MDRKRKLSIFYTARHKRKLAAKNTLTDIEIITQHSDHSTAIIYNNNQLDVDEHDNASSSICDSQIAQLDKNLNQSNNDKDSNVYFLDKILFAWHKIMKMQAAIKLSSITVY